jgi:hypothetical protein
MSNAVRGTDIFKKFVVMYNYIAWDTGSNVDIRLETCVTYLNMSVVQSDSKLLSGFQFIERGNSDNNLESLCILCSTVISVGNVGQQK